MTLNHRESRRLLAIAAALVVAVSAEGAQPPAASQAPATAPTLVVRRPDSPYTGPIGSFLRTEPFQIEVKSPGSGPTISVDFRTGNGVHRTLTLVETGPGSGAYLSQPITPKDGAQKTGEAGKRMFGNVSQEMEGFGTEDGEPVTVTFAGASNTFRVYDTNVTQIVGLHDQAFATIRRDMTDVRLRALTLLKRPNLQAGTIAKLQNVVAIADGRLKLLTDMDNVLAHPRQSDGGSGVFAPGDDVGTAYWKLRVEMPYLYQLRQPDPRTINPSDIRDENFKARNIVDELKRGSWSQLTNGIAFGIYNGTMSATMATPVLGVFGKNVYGGQATPEEVEAAATGLIAMVLMTKVVPAVIDSTAGSVANELSGLGSRDSTALGVPARVPGGATTPETAVNGVRPAAPEGGVTAQRPSASPPSVEATIPMGEAAKTFFQEIETHAAATELDHEIDLARRAGIPEAELNRLKTGSGPTANAVQNRLATFRILEARLKALGFEVNALEVLDHNQKPALTDFAVEARRLNQISIRASNGVLTPADIEWLKARVAADPSYFDRLPYRGYIDQYGPAGFPDFPKDLRPGDGFVSALDQSSAAELKSAYQKATGSGTNPVTGASPRQQGVVTREPLSLDRVKAEILKQREKTAAQTQRFRDAPVSGTRPASHGGGIEANVINPENIKSLTPAEVARFTPDDIRNLPSAVRDQLPLNHLSAEQLQAVADSGTVLTDDRIRALTPDTIRRLPPELRDLVKVEPLTPDQLHALADASGVPTPASVWLPLVVPTAAVPTNSAGGAPSASTLGLSPGSQPITSATTIAGSRDEQMREQLSNAAVYDSKFKDHNEITDYRTLKFFRNPDGSMTLQAPNRTYRAHFNANGLQVEDLGPTPATNTAGAPSAPAGTSSGDAVLGPDGLPVLTHTPRHDEMPTAPSHQQDLGVGTPAELEEAIAKAGADPSTVTISDNEQGAYGTTADGKTAISAIRNRDGSVKVTTRPAAAAGAATPAAPTAGKPVAAGPAEQKKMLDAMNRAIEATGGNPNDYHATWERDGSGVSAYDRVNDSSSSISVTWTGTGVAVVNRLKAVKASSGGAAPAPGGGNTMPGQPTGPTVVGKTAAASLAPSCKRADGDCDALRQAARERQADADAAARALPFAQNDLAAADAADREANANHDQADKTYATAAGFSQLGDKARADALTATAHEFDAKGTAASKRAEDLRAKAAATKAAAEQTAVAAAAAWSAYTDCMKLPPCPDDTASTTPGPVNMMPGAPAGGGLGEDTGSVCGTGDCVPPANCVGDCIDMARGCEADGTCQKVVDLIHQLMVSAVSAALGSFSASDDSGSRALPGSLRAVPRALAALIRRGNPFASRSHPIDLAPGTIVMLEPRRHGSGAERAEPSVSLVSTGSSTGDAFRLRITDPGGRARKISMPEGLVLQPIKQPNSAASTPPASAQPAGGSRATAIGAFCLEFAKLPPSAGMLYQVAPQALQQKFKSLQSVLQAATKLQQMGGLHPDSNPKTYADSIKQFAVWTRLEHWDAKKFEASFVELTKKNVAALKQNWTPAMENTIKDAAPGRWRDVQAVLQQADSLAARPAR